MDDDAIDFSELNPNADPGRYELAIDRITAAAAPILTRRRVQGSVWWQLTVWRKPVFAVGVAAILLMFGVAELGTVPDEEEVAVTDDLALALGVPAQVSDWATSETRPSAAHILYPGEE